MNSIKKLMVVLSVLTLMTSCSNKNNNPSPSQTNDIIIQDGWKIEFYSDNGKDETYKFSSYLINFKSDGTFEFYNDTQSTFSGSWYLDNQSDDNPSSSNKLVINISGNDLVNKLANDWLIVEINDNFIHLRDDNIDSQEILKISR